MKKIGFVGLGIMGAPMASHLTHMKDTQLLVNDLKEDAVQRLEDLGAVSASLEEIGGSCDLIFTILPNGEIVRDVLFGGQGIAPSLRKGTIVCDMSSVTPGQSREYAARLADLGVSFLDAPVSGGEPKAIDGTLAFMVGGEEPVFQQVLPYFEQMGSSAVLVGGCGNGSVAKLANQIIVNMNIAVVSEAFVFAAKAGADPQKVYEAIRGGLAGSTVMDAKVPMILERNFTPGGTLAINHKDIRNVLSEAHASDIPVPFTAQLFEIMQNLKVCGLMGNDHAGIVKYFEALAGCQVEKGEGDASHE